VRRLDPAVAMLGAIALALAFPKTGQAWLAPFGGACLVWAWQRLSPAAAFFTGWLAGTLFFSIGFSWFSYTVGNSVGRFAFAVVLVPALVEALAFAVSGLLTSFAARRAPLWAFPAAAACAFAVMEMARSIGPLAVPFAQIGYSQTNTPLAVFAAYIGSYGVTFIVMLLGAAIAQAIEIRRVRLLAVTVALIAGAWMAAYWFWPARHFATPSIRVAAVQGNVKQSIKWEPTTVRLSIHRYLALTARLASLHPKLVVLPETVIAEVLNADPALVVRLSALARSLHTRLIVGSLESAGTTQYNALYTFDPQGRLQSIYRKRQLVPFAEDFPGRRWLRRLPNADLISTFGAGTQDTVISAGGTSFAPLICWESAFADLVHAQVSRGAQVLVIATDDAWFGETSGTFQHAQIAQMRAIENGMWALQSASTGISGVIAPDGTWIQYTPLDREALLVANVGAPPGSIFARIGPAPVVAGFGLFYAGVMLWGSLRRKRRNGDA